MPNLSLHEVPVGIIDEEEVEMKEVSPEVPKKPEVVFENEETYRVAVGSMREGLVRLVNEGFMTQPVAERLLTEFMFSTFNQVIQLKLV